MHKIVLWVKVGNKRIIAFTKRVTKKSKIERLKLLKNARNFVALKIT